MAPPQKILMLSPYKLTARSMGQSDSLILPKAAANLSEDHKDRTVTGRKTQPGHGHYSRIVSCTPTWFPSSWPYTGLSWALHTGNPCFCQYCQARGISAAQTLSTPQLQLAPKPAEACGFQWNQGTDVQVPDTEQHQMRIYPFPFPFATLLQLPDQQAASQADS